MKYHISNGKPMPCHAKIRCPLGDDAPHFNSKDEAQLYADKKNETKEGTLAGINNTENNKRYVWAVDRTGKIKMYYNPKSQSFPFPVYNSKEELEEALDKKYAVYGGPL